MNTEISPDLPSNVWGDIIAIYRKRTTTRNAKAAHDPAKVVIALELLRSRKNAPTLRRELFEDPFKDDPTGPLSFEMVVNINTALQSAKIPFRLRSCDRGAKLMIKSSVQFKPL